MATLSVGKAWEEAVVFVRREANLMLPVALLFLALPLAILDQMIPADLRAAMVDPSMPRVQVPASVAVAFLLVMLLTQIGSLALYALALKPGISVAEALNLAVRRVPVTIGSGLLLMVAMVVIVLAASILAVPFAILGGEALGASIILLLMLPIVVYVAIRFTLLNAAIADQQTGPIACMRTAWKLTAGQFWRLFGFVTGVLLMLLILDIALGSVFGIVGGLLGGPDIATLTSGLASALIVAAVQVYRLTVVARLYRQAVP